MCIQGCDGASSAVGLEALAVTDVSHDVTYLPARPDGRLLAVEVRLRNGTDTSLLLAAPSFRLDPDAGASIVGSPLTELLDAPCAASAALAPGREVTCSVAFDVPGSFEPRSITFEAPSVRVTALLPGVGGAEDGGALATPDAGVPPPPTRQVDLLFVVDTGSSAALAHFDIDAAATEILERLSAGNVAANGHRGGGDFPGANDIHLAATSVALGAGGYGEGCHVAAPNGDDGLFLRWTYDWESETCVEVSSPFFTHTPDRDPLDGADMLFCSALSGSDCGIEQPLEATLKALSPSVPAPFTAEGYVPPMFLSGQGHGTGANAGFSRPDAALVVVLISDRDDCSVGDRAFYEPDSATYPNPLELRCLFEQRGLQPVARFIDGLVQLRRHPARVGFVAIVGIPEDLATDAGAPTDFERLVSPDESRRDPRMIVELTDTGPRRACDHHYAGDPFGYPAVRTVRAAEGLEAAGANVSVQSVCGSELDAIDEILRITRLSMGY